MNVAIVTSIHPDFDARIWKHAVSLAERGILVQFISPWDFQAVEPPSGITVRSFARVRSRVLRPFLIPPRVFSALRSCWNSIDLIHFHDIDLLPWMSFLGRSRPRIYDVHENYPDEMLVRDWIPGLARRPLFHAVRLSQRWLTRRIGHCVLVAESQKRDFDLPGVESIYVKNYASEHLLVDSQDNYLDRNPTVVFTGGQHRTNGSELLLDIAEACASRIPHLRFLATDRFASAEFKSWFEAELVRRGLSDRFRLTSFVPSQHILSVLNQGTIGISPNLRTTNQEKAIPTKLFEYMAAGLPIITSDLPNQKRIIADARCGLLASPEDLESYIGAIEQLVDNPTMAKQLGASGREAFHDRYCWESQMPALLDFYKTILTDHQLTPTGKQ